MGTLFIKNARIKDDDDLVNISIHEGRITEIQPATEGNTNNLIDTTIIDVEGNVVTPPFIESHIHPDKAFLEERLPNQSGTLEEAIQNTVELKKKYEEEYKEYTAAVSEASKLLRAGSKTEAERMHDGRKYHETLANLNEKYNEDIVSPFMITLGDEFQGLLHNGRNALKIIENLRSSMHPYCLQWYTYRQCRKWSRYRW